MPVDGSIFNNIHSFQDYNMANQKFLAEQQAAQLDSATKANVLKAQLVGGAAGSGDPVALAAVKQHLGTLGIDASDVPDDIPSAIGWANASINAQKPYALGNAIAKAVGVNAAGISALGSAADAAAGGLSIPVPTGAVTPPMQSGSQVPPAQSVASPRVITPPVTNGMTPAYKAGATDAIFVNPTPPGTPIAGDNTAPLTPLPSGAPQSSPSVSAAPPQPVKDPQETPANFNARLAAWQALPSVKKSDAAAESSGKAIGDQPVKVASSEETYSRVAKNIDGMLSINDKIPDAGLITPSMKGAIDQRTPSSMSDHATSDAVNSFTKVNKAQVLNGLQELLQSSTGIRSSRQLIGLIDQVNGIDINASTASRAQQLQAVKAELQNWKTSEENLSSKLNGGVQQPYQDIPMQTPAMAGTPKYTPGMTQTSATGTYLFNGGDPTQKSNWKKVQ